MNERELKYWLSWNRISEIGPKRFYKLIAYFGSAENAWLADTNEISKALSLSDKLSTKIFEEKKNIIPDEELRLLNKYNTKVLTINDELYPGNLKEIHDPPPIIYFKGSIIEKDKNSISIVGSRKATHYGKMVSESLSKDLALSGVTIVSGLARGIDTAAHRGALSVNGRTIAVLGCGINLIYPPENRRLAQEIENSGAIVTEFTFSTLPERQNFPQRNRIISGLSLGTLVVEAAEKSGALITADFALEQGREVFAVPGNINSSLSNGVHNLIKQGAKLVHSCKDILEEFSGIASHEINTKEVNPKQFSLSVEEEVIFNLISNEPVHIDEIIEISKLSVSKVSEVLLNLELKDLVREIEGKKFIKL